MINLALSKVYSQLRSFISSLFFLTNSFVFARTLISFSTLSSYLLTSLVLAILTIGFKGDTSSSLPIFIMLETTKPNSTPLAVSTTTLSPFFTSIFAVSK